MTFKVIINMDNEAFAEEPMTEIARILRQVADKAEDRGLTGSGLVRDMNGNTVGCWSIEESGVQS